MARVISLQEKRNQKVYEEIQTRPTTDYVTEMVVDKILIALTDYKDGKNKYPLSMILDAILIELCNLKKS